MHFKLVVDVYGCHLFDINHHAVALGRNDENRLVLVKDQKVGMLVPVL
jgi:hypothetical protein